MSFKLFSSDVSARSLPEYLAKTGLAMGVVIVLAVLLRVFIFQPHKIEGNEMAETLVAGDRFVCNTLVFGPRVLGLGLPGWRPPRANDVVVLGNPTDPGQRLVRRIVAGSGATVEISNKRLMVDRRVFEFPASARASATALVPGDLSCRDEMPAMRIPKPGDVVDLAKTFPMEFDFLVSLIQQENPSVSLEIEARLFLGEHEQSDLVLDGYALAHGPFRQLPFSRMRWVDFRRIEMFLQKEYPDQPVKVVRSVVLNRGTIQHYKVENACYFVMSDHWDEFFDSRVFGYVSETNILSKASSVYFSRDPARPWYYGPMAVRWSRILSFVR